MNVNQLQEDVNLVNENLDQILTCRHADPRLLELALDLHPEAITRVTFQLPERIQHVYALTRDDVQHLVDPLESTQVLVVERKPALIARFVNPCEAAQLVAVKADPALIKHIDSPCVAALMYVNTVAPKQLRGLPLSPSVAALWADFQK